MRRGEFVKFNAFYVMETLYNYQSRTNYDDIAAYFNEPHRVAKIKFIAFGEKIVYILCPASLGIEHGPWQAHEDNLISLGPAPHHERCKGCSWMACISKKQGVT